MEFQKASFEFNIRRYLWELSELQNEIDGGLANLGFFRAGAPRRFCKFVQMLSRSDQHDLARALLFKAYEEAARACNDSFPAEGAALLLRFRDFSLEEHAKELATKSCYSDKVKPARKGKLRKAVLIRFSEVFGARCANLPVVPLDEDLDFKIPCSGWTVVTHFEFNGEERQIRYWHDVISEKAIGEHGTPAMVIGRLIMWLGVTGAGEWKGLCEADVEAASEKITSHCARFINVVPRLLKGLEYSSVTPIQKG